VRAWQFRGTGEPLVLADVAEPTAAAGEVVVDVRAAGLCHTDVGVLEEPRWLPLLARRPITLGHEVAGVVSALGEGVEAWAVGDRVGICPTAGVGAPGFARDGGFATRLAFPSAALVRLPDAVSFALGAVGTDAGMTSHHALFAVGELQAGQKLGIIGLGGLGQIGARVGVLAGAEVYVAEIDESVWPLATEIGAAGVARSIRDFASVGLDLIVDFAGFGTTTADAIETVRHRGRVVQIGLGRFDALISTRELISRHVTLVGSSGGTIDDVERVYALCASGQLAPRVTPITFEQIPDGLERLRRGEVTGRLVADLGGRS
jgi:propanol-preferring alcohol dehydrogenase